MVIPCGVAAAAHSAGAAGTAGATAMGLGMGKSDLDLTRDLFKLQMRQAKRLWTADWAEASVRHGESCMQSAQQHSEAQAMATATYYQAEKLASQGIKLARDQDARSYEISWRSEVRESLRDELANQNNRFNIIMLCDTVCLSCVFSLVADGSPPTETPIALLNLYVFFMGFSIMLFTISLWCSVIVVRRLHEHTASILERMLFAQSEDLQKVWQYQLEKNLPTGPDVMHLVNQAYEKWVANYISPLGNCSIQMLSIGVVTMFITAGLLMHNQYLIEYNTPLSVPLIFWSTVLITSTTILVMKFSEDRNEKTKQGVYDVAWQDASTVETGPFAKIHKAFQELFSATAIDLGSHERMESMGRFEKKERDLCATTRSLHERVQSLRKESEQRSRIRNDVLQLLTTASEELDALPEELITRLNKLLHDIDEADSRTASLVAMRTENMLAMEGSHREWNRLLQRMPVTSPRLPMSPHPLDTQRLPVSLVSLRKELGKVSLTTLLRLKNMSDEPIRLKSGVRLKEGKYIKTLKASDPHNNQTVTYELYPGSEIPPRTEVVVAARSGGAWLPTSGIDGALVYTNRDETWHFKIQFTNELVRNIRKCQVKADHVVGLSEEKDDNNADQYWQISKDEFDRKANNEVVISFDMLSGEAASKAADDHRRSQVTIKAGFLQKNKAFGLKLQWQQRWFVLTSKDITYYTSNLNPDKQCKIALKDITSVRRTSDLVKKNVFEIHTSIVGSAPYRLSAESPEDCDDWIRKISGAAGFDSNSLLIDANPSNTSEYSTASSLGKYGIECIHSPLGGTEVLPTNSHYQTD